MQVFPLRTQGDYSGLSMGCESPGRFFSFSADPFLLLQTSRRAGRETSRSTVEIIIDWKTVDVGTTVDSVCDSHESTVS